MTATPDTIVQNGRDVSSIQVIVRDPNSQPVSGLTLVLGMSESLGTLSASRIVTGSDGKANAVYTAPPTLSSSSGGITLFVTPVLNNAQVSSFNETSVSIRLLKPAPVPVPPGAPTASFTYTPSSPKVNGDVSFNAGSSTAGTGHTLVRFDWDFGDGTAKTSSGSMSSHDFGASGSYSVRLTVTDEIGQTHEVAGLVSVVP